MNDLAFEAAYWGDCTNTFDEEQKHYVYARLMGLTRVGFSFDACGKSVLDIGGGPVSMLLKCTNRGPSIVADPLMMRYPKWVRERYNTAGIPTPCAYRGEDLVAAFGNSTQYDEVWIYNCLQHVDDPAKIIANARALAPVLRIFEWVNIPPHEGHPHMLTREKLDEWIDSRGSVATLVGEGGCFGEAYFGVFSR